MGLKLVNTGEVREFSFRNFREQPLFGASDNKNDEPTKVINYTLDLVATKFRYTNIAISGVSDTGIAQSFSLDGANWFSGLIGGLNDDLPNGIIGVMNAASGELRKTMYYRLTLTNTVLIPGIHERARIRIDADEDLNILTMPTIPVWNTDGIITIPNPILVPAK